MNWPHFSLAYTILGQSASRVEPNSNRCLVKAGRVLVSLSVSLALVSYYTDVPEATHVRSAACTALAVRQRSQVGRRLEPCSTDELWTHALDSTFSDAF